MRSFLQLAGRGIGLGIEAKNEHTQQFLDMLGMQPSGSEIEHPPNECLRPERPLIITLAPKEKRLIWKLDQPLFKYQRNRSTYSSHHDDSNIGGG
jgi:hypothetical protein